jgi:hypothetical protein
MALTHDRVFQMRASEEFLRQIDDWRREQPDLPSRAEAIRRLIEAGLKTTQVSHSGGGNPGPAPRGKLGASRAPRKPAAPERKAKPAAPINKEAQIRALREQGAR